VAIEDQPSGIDLLRSTLVRAYSAAAENRYLHRLHCVLLMLHGLSSARIAAWFVHDKTTVAGWRRRFERLGLQGLRDQERTGRPAVLDRKQLAELQRCLRRPPAESGFPTARKWQGKLVSAWLERRYGLYLSLRQCQRLLRDAGKIDAPAADAKRRSPSPPPNRHGALAIWRSPSQPQAGWTSPAACRESRSDFCRSQCVKEPATDNSLLDGKGNVKNPDTSSGPNGVDGHLCEGCEHRIREKYR